MTTDKTIVHLRVSAVPVTGEMPAVAAHWPLHRVATLAELRRIVAAGPVGVVLAELEFTTELMAELFECVTAGPTTRWIALLRSEQLQQESVRQLIATCFHDYHTVPFDSERLGVSVGHAMGMSCLEAQSRGPGPFRIECGLVGNSTRMLNLFGVIQKVASVEAPVLVHGESGTGKELAAKAVHQRSKRASAPFIAVNCGSLPANLIQSELFGFEKGAFTGATQRRVGRIEAASGGSVFLDEIGDLPLEQQVHLLRFLEEGTIDRLGSNRSVHPDTRVITATHIDLEEAVAEGRFREDLFYRLNVLCVEMPSLRERSEDVERLAWHFFERFQHERASGVRGFTRQAIYAMECHDWPGNVRELMNRVRRAMVMCERRLITEVDLGLRRRGHERRFTTLEQARSDAEREAMVDVLRGCRWNVTRAAAQLGVSRVTMYRLMEKHSIRSDGVSGDPTAAPLLASGPSGVVER